MSTLKLVNINKIYDNNVQAVFDFNLEIKDKEFIVFVGPSGCGKSTTLRMIAGLEEITDGELYIDDKLMNLVHPKDRDIAMVFQSYALYPHMSVYENMAFGLKVRRLPKDEIDRRINAAAEILGLTPYLKRKPKALSGGQRQRVALGRAIVREPKVFLMDEPLSNLDAKLRVQMRSEIIKIHERVGATTIYVTHDQIEAMTMANRIVVMKDGWIQQIGSPAKLYNEPINMFVAGFIGSPAMNFIKGEYLDGKVTFGNGFSFSLSKEDKEKHNQYYASVLEKTQKQYDSRLEEINEYNELIKDKKHKKPIVVEEDSDLLKYQKIIEGAKQALEEKKHPLIIGIRPEDIFIAQDPAKENASSEMKFKCDLSELLGHERIVYAFLDEEQKLTIKVNAKYEVMSGDENDYVFNLKKIHLFDENTTESILYKE